MIIALCGRKSSGKDTVASFIAKKTNFQRIAFGDPLKDMLSEIFKVPRHFFDDVILKEKLFDSHLILNQTSHLRDLNDFVKHNTGKYISQESREKISDLFLKKEYVKSPRDLMQFIATDIIRDHVSPTFWIDLTIKKMLSSENPNYVITDCRFVNEREALKKLGATLVYIERGNMIKDFHISEMEFGDIKDYDVTIQNDCSLIELEYEIGLWLTSKGLVK